MIIQNFTLVRKLINLALEEDLGLGDVTTNLALEPCQLMRAEVIARESITVCGLNLIEAICEEFKAEVKCELLFTEGAAAPANSVLAELSGRAIDILALERTVLNFLQRMSGVATHTASIVRNIGSLVLLDTRKTVPGWRVLDKYAVKVGGASNHRMNLSEMIMVKDTHIDAAGGVSVVLGRIFSNKPLYMPVEVEVRSEVELRQALEYPINMVLLDNMTDQELEKAIKIIRESGSNVSIEVSGGIRPERLQVLEKLGVTCVSMGALTSQATSVDIALEAQAL